MVKCLDEPFPLKLHFFQKKLDFHQSVRIITPSSDSHPSGWDATKCVAHKITLINSALLRRWCGVV